jgi:diacylglycerol kinase (ATP)
MIRAGVIRNLKSHRNQAGARDATPPGVLEALPDEPDDLDEVLSWFAASGVDLVVIDGGDGTVRDVLSRVTRAYGERMPRFAILPHGKTNALALDLGLRPGTPVENVLAAARAGPRTKVRACLEVLRDGEVAHRGYLFGTGAFVETIEYAQRTHAIGLFHSAAIAMTVVGAGLSVMLGSNEDRWRRGVAARVAIGDEAAVEGRWFSVLAACLKRFPLGIRPFGPPHEGLKVLAMPAPPRRFHRALPVLLRGDDAPWLAEAGYRRADVRRVAIATEGGFVLDGEIFGGGDLQVREGPAIEYVIP